MLSTSFLQINYKFMRYLFILLSLLSIHLSAQKAKHNVKPKLVVGVVLDQMRPDYLIRFNKKFSQKGFNRLLKNGNECVNAFINYLPSYTGPGHTCIYTGSVPSLHGIASNDWFDRNTGKSVYCTQDNDAKNVGGTLKSGKMSPKNLWATTITDELRLASNFKSKVIAISVKDRASILPGGHTANASYWMDDSNGVFMTSDFYMKSLPSWVSDFNTINYASKLMNQNWNPLLPINNYIESTSDDNKYEGKFAGEYAPTFPHNTSNLKLSDIKKTPFGNEILTLFAKEVLKNEKLGQGDETDFLAISYSSTDYVGHQFGPNSIEIEDTYLRMDQEIEKLLSFLDAQVGEGNYTLFLTADHAVAHNPQFLMDNKIPAGYFFGKVLKDTLNKFLLTKFQHPKMVNEIGENFIWLNDSLLKNSTYKKEEIIAEILNFCNQKEEIQFAVDMNNIDKAMLPSIIKEMAINGFVAKRSGDILLLLNPAWLDAYAKTGTTHGTWNPYDTHIPLIWFGAGIQKGKTMQQVYMTDIAATLATLLHIQMPNACIGKTIEEVLK
jgi:predicted AlkP superfamily pyrophosphatase or phosphodiesterase